MHQRLVSHPCIMCADAANWEGKAIDLAAHTTLQSTLGISALIDTSLSSQLLCVNYLGR